MTSKKPNVVLNEVKDLLFILPNKNKQVLRCAQDVNFP